MRRRLSEAPSANRAEGAAAPPMNDKVCSTTPGSVRPLRLKRMPSTVAMMIGLTSTARAACATTRKPAAPPPRRLSSSSTVTELNTMTSRVMIRSAGTPPASPYTHSSSGSASMTPLEKAEPKAWMVISAARMPNASRATLAPARNTSGLREEVAAEKAPLGDLVELGLGHQAEHVRRDREVEHEGAEPADARLAEKARPAGEETEKDHREQRDDGLQDGDQGCVGSERTGVAVAPAGRGRRLGARVVAGSAVRIKPRRARPRVMPT